MKGLWALVQDVAVPVALGTVIIVAAVLRGGRSDGAVALALSIGLAAALGTRRRAPGWTLALCGTLFLILISVDAAAAPTAVLAPALALFSLALTRGRGEQLLAGLAAVVAVIVAGALRGRHPGVAETFGHIALVGIPLLAAETLRTRRSYVAVLLDRLALADQRREQEARRRVEAERLRIARDLHDVVAHTLTAITVQAGVAGELLERQPEHARGALAAIEESSRDAIGELRAILGVLRDREDPGAPTTPAPGLGDLGELLARARDNGLEADLLVIGPRPDHISDAVSLAAFRIVQESLTNARRHAAGAPVRVRLTFADQLEVTVENPAGVGLDPGSAANNGVGVIGMTERAEAVGGTLRATALATGFRVSARLPYTLPAP